MKVECPVLDPGHRIPVRYARRGVSGGANISLPVVWSDPPAGTTSYVLTIIDRHPIARNWVHWYVVDIPAAVEAIPENASGHFLPGGAMELRNTFGEIGYGGPEPPKGSGTHQYEISVHALRVGSLGLGPRSSPSECDRALKENVLATATVIGLFER
jgi:hypothetical protein